MRRQGWGLGLAPTSTLGYFHCRHNSDTLSSGNTAGLVWTHPHGQGASDMRRLGKLLGHFWLRAQRSVLSLWTAGMVQRCPPAHSHAGALRQHSCGLSLLPVWGWRWVPNLGSKPKSLLNYMQGLGPSYVFAQALGLLCHRSHLTNL